MKIAQKDAHWVNKSLKSMNRVELLLGLQILKKQFGLSFTAEFVILISKTVKEKLLFVKWVDEKSDPPTSFISSY